MKTGKVTMYVKGEFLGNVVKIEAKEAEIEIKPFAQYTKAVHVTFKKPRQKKARCLVQSYSPSLLVLEGWGHPDPASPWTPPVERENGVTVRESKYSSCDERWQSDFNGTMAEYLEKNGATVVADFRAHNSH